MELTKDQLPFTKAEYYAAIQKYADNVQEELGGRTREKVSASAIGDCSRKILADLRGIPTTNLGRADSVVTMEQGRTFEEIPIEAFTRAGAFIERGMSLPDSYPLAGHPDGQLTFYGDKANVWDGYKWGWEHKLLGRYQYKETMANGFAIANPGYMAQILIYGHALDWDRVLVQVTAQDASSITAEYNQEKRKKEPAAWATDPEFDPKTLFFGYDIQAMFPLVPQLHQRAAEILAIPEAKDIAREYSGTVNFPCNYCRVKDWCNTVGDGGIEVTPTPFGKK